MKNLKKLLSSLLALTLVFCSLSAGMTVLAAEEDTDATETPFASFTVDGRQIDFSKRKDYSILNYNKTSATIEWTLNGGWASMTVGYFDYSTGEKVVKELRSGDTVNIPKNGSLTLFADAVRRSGALYFFFSGSVEIVNGKAELTGGTLWAGSGADGLHWSGVAGGGVQILSVTSSNTAALSVKKVSDDLYGYTMTPKKPGKAKLTVKTLINGEEKIFTAKYTVKAYPNALKELKVGGKTINLKKNKFYAEVKAGKKKVKVEYKAAKGWKVKAIYYNGKKYVNVKSGGTVPAPKWVFFRLTKGKDVFDYDISIFK